MRKFLAFALAPAAGLGVFTLVLASPELQVAHGAAGFHLDPVPPTGIVLAYLAVLLISVPVFREVRAGFGWTGWSTSIAALVVYSLAFAGLSHLPGGGIDFLRGWPEWVGLVSGALVHSAVFLSFRPGTKRFYFFS